MREWFPHDYHASQDLAIIRILRVHGSRGYGVFWLATELLHANENVMRGSLEDFILHTFRDLSLEECQKILSDLIDSGLLKIGGCLYESGEEEHLIVYSDLSLIHI